MRDRLSEFLWTLSCRIDDLGNFIAHDYEIPYQHFAHGRTLAERKDWTLPVCKVNLERTLTSHEILGDRWRAAIALENDRLEAEAFITAREKGRDSKFPEGTPICGDPYTGWYPQK